MKIISYVCRNYCPGVRAFGCAIQTCVVAAVLISAGCSRDNAVRISVDFGRSPRWEYLFTADVAGRLVAADTVKEFSNGAVCRLLGTPRKGSPATLDVRLDQVTLRSSILDSGECSNLEQQFEDAQLGMELENGTIELRDSGSLPVIRIGEWDLLRTFVRVIPSLPARKMLRGQSWEREKQIPLMASYGSATGHLYQTFTFDSLGSGSNRDCAYISWRFTYRIEPLEKDSLKVYAMLPLTGNGTGEAVFNVSQKYLASARVRFKVPRPHEGLDISWEEIISLRLKEG